MKYVMAKTASYVPPIEYRSRHGTLLSPESGVGTLPPMLWVRCGACLLPVTSRRGPGNRGGTVAGPRLNLVVGAHRVSLETDPRGATDLDRWFRMDEAHPLIKSIPGGMLIS